MIERFMKNVRLSDDCWEWIGASDAKGYGLFWLDGSTRRAHRVAIELITGETITGKVILHTCDNTCCVNPEHLRVGTQKDNVRDMHDKGRQASKVGSLNGASKLTEDMIVYIRTSTLGHTALGRELGVSKTTIMRVRSGKSWSHVGEQND